MLERLKGMDETVLERLKGMDERLHTIELGVKLGTHQTKVRLTPLAVPAMSQDQTTKSSSLHDESLSAATGAQDHPILHGDWCGATKGEHCWSPHCQP